jgi:hypothetical protein
MTTTAVTALVITAACAVTGLILWSLCQRRQRAERARQERIRSALADWLPAVRPTVAALRQRVEREHYEEYHYGFRALHPRRSLTVETSVVPVRRQRDFDLSDSMPLLSGDAFVPMAGPHHCGAAYERR